MTPTRLSRLKSISINTVIMREVAAAAAAPEFNIFGAPLAGDIGNSFHGGLYRPYLDLTKDAEVAVHSEGVLLAYQHLAHDRANRDWVQQLHPPAFRDLLAAALNRPEPADTDPCRALEPNASPRVAAVIDHIHNARDLSPVRLHALIKLLAALGFYRYILTKLPKPARERWEADAGWAGYAYVFYSVRANYSTGYSLGVPAKEITYWPVDLMELYDTAPRGSRARLDSALRLCVLAGKVLRNQDLVRRYASAAASAFGEFEDDGTFHYRLLASKYLRAVSFEPMMAGDRNGLTQILDEAESHARSLVPGSEEEHLLKRDNLMTLLETRTREAQWNRDLDRAEELVSLSASMNPLDPMRHSVRGEVLAQRGKWAEAAGAFERAAVLGPPITPMAWYMAGQCREKLAEYDVALSHYIACIQVDPGAVSAYQSLSVLARQCGAASIARNAEAVLDRLLKKVSPSIVRSNPGQE